MHRTAPLPNPRLPLWKRLLFAAIITTTFVSVPEALLRWTDLGERMFPHAFEDPYDQAPGSLWYLSTYDPVLSWKGRPFAPLPGSNERLSSRGFREPDFADYKPPATTRIVCMGDSSTFGVVYHGSDRFTFNPTYSAELQTLLNTETGSARVEVINAGVIGYSTLQGLRLLKHVVRDWAPDVITLRYGTNDHWRSDPNHVLAVEPRTAVARWTQDWLLEKRTYQMLVRLRDSSHREGLKLLASLPEPLPAPPGPPANRVPLPEFEFNLRRLVAEGRALGAQVVLITAPLAPVTAEIAQDRGFLQRVGYDSMDEVVTQHALYEEVVRVVAADLGVPLLDSSRDFAARGPERFFTRYDPVHPNADGHRAIARDLAALLRSTGIVSQ